ncbi:sporulation domain-containing protein [Flammeovirgaceae bacterium 311]|nr:sporulation domain-containing protein [Flammeovirgaceae bacterium 311]
MYDQQNLNNQDETTYQIQQDDEYGLPEAEFSPIENAQPVAAAEPVRQKREIDLQPKQERSSWPIWAGIIILLAVAGFSLYYFVFKADDEVVAPRITETIQQPAPEPEPEIVDEAPVEENWIPEAEAPKEGGITTITEKTGRYYVIVGSFIDGDMAGDYAKKLAAEGRQVTLIEPSGNKKFYRLGVAEAASFAEAGEELEDLKNTFGQEIWIVRY